MWAGINKCVFAFTPVLSQLPCEITASTKKTLHGCRPLCCCRGKVWEMLRWSNHLSAQQLNVKPFCFVTLSLFWPHMPCALSCWGFMLFPDWDGSRGVVRNGGGCCKQVRYPPVGQNQLQEQWAGYSCCCRPTTHTIGHTNCWGQCPEHTSTMD